MLLLCEDGLVVSYIHVPPAFRDTSLQRDDCGPISTTIKLGICSALIVIVVVVFGYTVENEGLHYACAPGKRYPGCSSLYV